VSLFGASHETFLFQKYLPPWSVEFNEHKLILSQFFIKVLIGKDYDTVIHFGGSGALEREESGENAQ